MLPNKADALRNAEQFVGQGNLNAAIAVYRSLIESDPLDLNSIQALGDLYVRAGRTQEALHELTRLADRLIALGPAINAAPLLKKMVELDPSNTASRMKLAAVYARSGKLDLAHQVFIEAGAVFARKGNLVAAMEAVKKALAINPDSPQARAALASLEGQTSPYVVRLPNAGHPMPPAAPPASAAPNRPAETKPRGTTELAEIGQMLSSAAVDFSAADVTDEFIVRQLFAAELLAGCGDTDKAVAVLKRIIDHRPDAVEVRTKLTDIYLRSGMMREASQEFLEIARIYESQGDAARAKDFNVRAERLRLQLGEPPARPSAEPMPDQPDATGDQIILGSASQMPAAGPPAALPATSAETVKTEPPLAAVMREPSTANAAIASLSPGEMFAKVAGRRDSQTTLVALDAQAAVAGNRVQRGRVVFYAVAATVIIALLGGWFAARRWYATEMDRAYQALARVNTLPIQPPVVTADQFTLPRSEERMDVRAESTAPATPAEPPAPQPSAAARGEGSPRDEAHKEPASTPAVNPDAAAGNRNTAPTLPRSAPPVISTTPNVATDPTSPPQNLPVSMPQTVGSSAPPPPVEARKAAVIIRGESIQRVQPDYPAKAREMRQAGVVAVEVSINDRGEVVAAQALSGPTLLRGPAIAAARRWKFKPATRDGKPISSVSTITFNFKM